MVATAPLFTTPRLASRFPGLLMAESTRHGGVSRPPFASLNLGLHTADDPAAVAENRRRFWQALGIEERQVAASHQVHGDAVKPVTGPGAFEGYDALITHIPGIFLAVTVADCTPVLVYDPVTKAVAAVHAGWRGTVAGIVGKTLDRMKRHYGTDPRHCVAYVGTCIDRCSFEVGEEVALRFESRYVLPADAAGKFFVDLRQANADQLIGSGLSSGSVEISPYSTFLDNHSYFSYRKEKGSTGRMLGVIGLRG